MEQFYFPGPVLERSEGMEKEIIRTVPFLIFDMAVRQDPAGNIKPDKSKSTERIDGMVAMIMAIDRAIRNQGHRTSVYEDRGILVI